LAGQRREKALAMCSHPSRDPDPHVIRECRWERFRAERQILASLNHPNIARLLDGGVSQEGLPYLVIELVDGEPIDRYYETSLASLRQRLNMFVTVGEATQYAHRNLVVHRDLKPSNIFVTNARLALEDGAPDRSPSRDEAAAQQLECHALRDLSVVTLSVEHQRHATTSDLTGEVSDLTGEVIDTDFAGVTCVRGAARLPDQRRQPRPGGESRTTTHGIARNLKKP
jgi:serine/threonine protein kinase